MNASEESNLQLAIVHSTQTLVGSIASALVDHQEAVHVEVMPDGEGVIFCLHVAPEDLGRVIGKQGRTARSIRTILAASSMKVHRRFTLDIHTSE